MLGVVGIDIGPDKAAAPAAAVVVEAAVVVVEAALSEAAAPHHPSRPELRKSIQRQRGPSLLAHSTVPTPEHLDQST